MDDLDPAIVDARLLDQIRTVISDGHWPIYLHAPTGRGKSFAVAEVYCRWQGSAYWYDVSSLLRKIMRIRASSDGFIYEPRSDGKTAQIFECTIMEHIASASLVCFDEVGLRSPSDAMYDAWYEAICLRRKKPTIFTGNLPPEELHKVYDARIASRMTGGTVIELTGPDRRLSTTRFVKI